ncbi:MAG TPA: 50S ribosomal protein L5 [Candidatus Polarisedimenticolia bacterium]|nr:50S ribosomal protein L5 [Candidatus Polarisedimenticolia bacterium]
MAPAPAKQPRLRRKYQDEVVPSLRESFQITNPMAVPRLTKVVVSMGLGAAKENKELLKEAAGHLATLTGQKPVVTKARQSIAGFKVREGMEVGMKVTLRRDRMWEFLDRLIAVAIPRIRDFRGFSRKAFDGRGNYSIGLSEQSVFPEIDLDSVKNVIGMNITVVTTAGDDARATALLEALGMPFQKVS